jgi:hypothetical protein
MVAGWVDATDVALGIRTVKGTGNPSLQEKGQNTIGTLHILRHGAHPDLTCLCPWRHDEIG